MKYCSHCGKEIMDEALICIYCGCAVDNKGTDIDIPSTGLNILALFFPIIGLIMFLVFHDKTPNKANKIGKFALIGFCIGILGWLMLFLGSII